MRNSLAVNPMGLLKLLAFPLTGPLAIAKVVRDEAERQLYDEDAIHRQMAELQQRHRAGEIADEDFDAQEEALFERLLDARQHHRQNQIGTED